MALLDPEPRVALVTAVEDTQLLRLDQEPFYELIDDRIEVVRGIIHVLSGHLRNRVRDLNEMRSRIRELETLVEKQKL
jgi:CRP-like cAMP-binding protein